MRRPTVGLLAAFDVLYCALFVVVVGTPLAGTVELFALASRHVPRWLNVGLLPAYVLLFLFGMIAVIRIIRLFLPRLEPGTFKIPGHPKARAWFFHFALQRIVYLPVWRPLIFSIAILRTAALRALGARVPMAISTASDPQILDAGLVTIGRGAVIGAGVMTTCHFMLANRLRLAEVNIGADAQLHESAKLALGVTVGDGAIVGPETFVGPDCTIGAGARLGPGCRFLGAVTIGDKAKIGAMVIVEREVHIGAGAVVATGSYLPKGTVVLDGGRFPPHGAGDSREEDRGAADARTGSST